MCFTLVPIPTNFLCQQVRAAGVIDDQMEDTEVGRGGMSGSEEGVLMAKLVVDEETDQLKPSDDDDDDDAEVGTGTATVSRLCSISFRF